jgi:hypothetical protein
MALASVRVAPKSASSGSSCGATPDGRSTWLSPGHNGGASRLRRALVGIPEHTADQQLLEKRLAEVITEQEARDAPGYPERWEDEPT